MRMTGPSKLAHVDLDELLARVHEGHFGLERDGTLVVQALELAVPDTSETAQAEPVEFIGKATEHTFIRRAFIYQVFIYETHPRMCACIPSELNFSSRMRVNDVRSVLRPRTLPFEDTYSGEVLYVFHRREVFGRLLRWLMSACRPFLVVHLFWSFIGISTKTRSHNLEECTCRYKGFKI